MHRIIIDENGNETKIDLTQEEVQALQEQAAIALEKEEVQPLTKVTLEEKITAILTQFNTDRSAGKNLIPELDTIVTNEMKG
jgi:hypothetical protein